MKQNVDTEELATTEELEFLTLQLKPKKKQKKRDDKTAEELIAEVNKQAKRDGSPDSAWNDMFENPVYFDDPSLLGYVVKSLPKKYDSETEIITGSPGFNNYGTRKTRKVYSSGEVMMADLERAKAAIESWGFKIVKALPRTKTPHHWSFYCIPTKG